MPLFEPPHQAARLLVLPEDIAPDTGKFLIRQVYPQDPLHLGVELPRDDSAGIELPRHLRVEECVVYSLLIEPEPLRQLLGGYIVVEPDYRIAQIEDYELILFIHISVFHRHEA